MVIMYNSSANWLIYKSSCNWAILYLKQSLLKAGRARAVFATIVCYLPNKC